MAEEQMRDENGKGEGETKKKRKKEKHGRVRLNAITYICGNSKIFKWTKSIAMWTLRNGPIKSHNEHRMVGKLFNKAKLKFA